MPDWCSNELHISGHPGDLRKFRKAAVGYPTNYGNPDPLDTTNPPSVLSFHTLDTPPKKVREAEYGDAGYQWEKQNWGCKWGACSSELKEVSSMFLTYTFDTPWTTPLRFIQKISSRYRRLTFKLCYDDTSYGVRGYYTCRQGDIVATGRKTYEAESDPVLWGDAKTYEALYL